MVAAGVLSLFPLSLARLTLAAASTSTLNQLTRLFLESEQQFLCFSFCCSSARAQPNRSGRRRGDEDDRRDDDDDDDMWPWPRREQTVVPPSETVRVRRSVRPSVRLQCTTRHATPDFSSDSRISRPQSHFKFT